MKQYSPTCPFLTIGKRQRCVLSRPHPQKGAFFPLTIMFIALHAELIEFLYNYINDTLPASLGLATLTHLPPPIHVIETPCR